MNFVFLVFFNLLLVAIVFLYINFQLKKIVDSNSVSKQVASQVDDMIRELNQATDRNLNLVEIQIESLKALSQEADMKLEEIDSKIKEWERYKDLIEGKIPDLETEGFKSPVNIIRRDGRIAFSIDQNVKNNSSVFLKDRPYQEKSSYSESPLLEGESLRKSREKEVLTLHNQGIGLDIIAKKLKMDLGEVELIISLKAKGS